jgi:O-antigen/teichoic acid export membrane protein
MYLKKALRGISIVFVITIFASIAAYLFRLVLARNLTVAEYGLFYAFYAFFSIFMIFTDLGLMQAVSKHIVDFKIEKRKRDIKSIIVYSFYFQTAVSIIISIILFILSPYLLPKIFHITDTTSFIIMSLWFITVPITMFFTNLFLGFQKPALNSSMELLRQISAIAFTLLFLYLHIGRISPFLAYLSMNITLLVVYFPFIKIIFPEFFKIKTKFDPILFKKIFKYGFYIAITSMIGLVLTQTDTLMLTYFKGLESVGIYQAALPIATLVTYFIPVLFAVAYPMISELYKKKKKSTLNQGIVLIQKYFFIASALITIILFLFPELLINILFGQKYLGAVTVLKVLSVAMLFSTITSINNMITSATGHTKHFVKIMIYAAVMNIILNFILIPKYDIVGAAVATMISVIFSAILSTQLLKKILDINSPIRQWAITSVAAFLTIISGIVIQKIYIGSGIIYFGCLAAISILTYIIILFLCKIINLKEIMSYITQMRN